MWLGSLIQNKGKRSPFNISWPEKYVIALGVAFAYDPAVSCRINFEEKLVSLKKTLTRCSARNLTLIGRICIVKTRAISKVVYNTSVLSASPNLCKQVNDICFRFVWKVKPDKIKRHTLIGPRDKGGLNMIDFVRWTNLLKLRGQSDYVMLEIVNGALPSPRPQPTSAALSFLNVTLIYMT